MVGSALVVRSVHSSGGKLAFATKKKKVFLSHGGGGMPGKPLSDREYCFNERTLHAPHASLNYHEQFRPCVCISVYMSELGTKF